MKHSFLAVIAALIAITPLAGRSETSAVGISRSGNKLEINANNKSINISVDSTGTGAKAVITISGDTLVSTNVNNPVGRLNDTLLATSSFYASSQDDDQDQYEQQELDYYEHAQQMQMRSQLTAIVIVAIIFGAITLIVVACLVIYYMNRRRRLRVIEKAIENGYQLPDSFYSGKTGMPKYAAPEQVLEAGQKMFHVDKTADFYELGVTLYELLTGTNPFDAPTMEETLELQRTKLLPESPEIPKALMDVLLRATDKYPQNRFQSALDFKKAIQQSFMVKEKKNNWLLPICIGGIAGVILILILMLLL